MRNEGKEWSDKDIQDLKRLADTESNMTTMIFVLGRTEAAIRNKASELGISLKPRDK